MIYRYLDEQNPYELYDLQNDPTESNNLATDNTDKLKSMLEAMAKQLKAMGAQYPHKNGRRVELVMP